MTNQTSSANLQSQQANQDNQLQLKKAAARAALDYIKDDMILGVGTGSTVNCLIELLPKVRLKGAVASSNVTQQKLQELGIEVMDLNFAGELDLYIDGADEFNSDLQLIKGGGGALTREKIVAAASKKFVCVVDESKQVDKIGKAFPVPIEVLPQARSYVARQLAHFGAEPVYREGFVTDYGNVILDTYDLPIDDPQQWETKLNNIVGIVCNGIFAAQKADVVLLAKNSGVETLR